MSRPVRPVREVGPLRLMVASHSFPRDRARLGRTPPDQARLGGVPRPARRGLAPRRRCPGRPSPRLPEAHHEPWHCLPAHPPASPGTRCLFRPGGTTGRTRPAEAPRPSWPASPAADPAARDSLSAPAVIPLSARALIPVPGPSAWGSASGQVTPCSEPASATRGSVSVVRGPPSVPPASGVAAASAVTGRISASQVLSSLPPEPVLRSSASGVALPSSVAGGDGTRLKYRPGLALRTNSRVVRKCFPVSCRCQHDAADRSRVPR